VQGQSFVGIAFHGVDSTTYDAIYFRPFNFKTPDPARHSHAVQYISNPTYTWQRLRTERPGVFEQPVSPAPDPNQWFHVRVVVASPKVSVFVGDAKQPSLVVDQLSDRTKGGSAGGWGTPPMAISPTSRSLRTSRAPLEVLGRRSGAASGSPGGIAIVRRAAPARSLLTQHRFPCCNSCYRSSLPVPGAHGGERAVPDGGLGGTPRLGPPPYARPRLRPLLPALWSNDYGGVTIGLRGRPARGDAAERGLLAARRRLAAGPAARSACTVAGTMPLPVARGASRRAWRPGRSKDGLARPSRSIARSNAATSVPIVISGWSRCGWRRPTSATWTPASGTTPARSRSARGFPPWCAMARRCCGPEVRSAWG